MIAGHCAWHERCSQSEPDAHSTVDSTEAHMRVLIVDDSGTARKILKKMLPAELRTDVIEAADGRQALESCRQNTIGLMFLDLTMPEIDGYAVLASLGPAALASLPVVVISGDVQDRARDKVMGLGARAYLKKPLSAEELLATLQRVGVL
jgi:CheY-like chemotaxis protein